MTYSNPNSNMSDSGCVDIFAADSLPKQYIVLHLNVQTGWCRKLFHFRLTSVYALLLSVEVKQLKCKSSTKSWICDVCLWSLFCSGDVRLLETTEMSTGASATILWSILLPSPMVTMGTFHMHPFLATV